MVRVGERGGMAAERKLDGYDRADERGLANANPRSGIKLVASDLDGTLLLNGSPKPTAEALELIERLAARDVPFFAASGRQYASLRWLFAPVADRMGYVCENGALVMLGDRVLVKHVVPRDLVLEMCRAIMETPRCEFLASGERTCYAPQDRLEFIDRLRNFVHNDVTPVARPEDIDEPVIKVAFRVPHEDQASVCAQMAERFAGRCRVVVSGQVWLDFLTDGVDKGTALAEVGQRLDIDPSQMLAFGDNENDREMLELVGHPYLMRGGNPSLEGLNDRLRRCDTVEGVLRRLLDMPGALG